MRADVIFGIAGVTLVVLGIPLALGRVGANPWYGFRIPATLRDREIWYAVNARAGRDLIATGVALLVAVLLVIRLGALPADAATLISALVLIIGAVVGTVRGYRLASRLSRAQQADERGAA